MKKEISFFLFHCEIEKKLSPKTLKAYETDLRQFATFLKTDDLTKITKDDLKLYLGILSKFASRTMKRKVATLKTFFSFLEFEEAIETNPFHKVRIKIKLEKLLPKILSIAEINAILKNVYAEKASVNTKNSYQYKEAIRNVAILELLLATGIRVSELCGLKKENIGANFETIRILGKGNKERNVPITNTATQEALQNNYLSFKTMIDTSSYFFINRFGNPISTQSVRFLVKKYAMKANIQRTITPHVFRHSFATLLLEEDVDIRYIQHFLGHSSINVTQMYAHVNEKKKTELLTVKNPRNFVHF
ncbi:tyrosine-type recombinase/integrase [Kordia jejudonensis]|uniref:tyrosine-type recombinase/integrase n=1 Tax=Kordia jejudonensis TaxID=1348245 RepID=UPI0006297AAD|nr:tyrosine-type recombinase/integrase [Kordia jejudonensis]